LRAFGIRKFYHLTCIIRWYFVLIQRLKSNGLACYPDCRYFLKNGNILDTGGASTSRFIAGAT
jgi:hypothetical protein